MSTVQEVIRERRTIRNFTSEDIRTEVIMELLEDAVYAPNHKLREPWSFILVRDEAKKHLYEEIYASYRRQEVSNNLEKKMEKMEVFIKSCPIHLIVTMEQSTKQKVWEEDYAATCALIQNLQLLGWDKQIGMVWKTNPYIYDPAFSEAMGIQSDKKIVGVIHIGKPAQLPKAKIRKKPNELVEIRTN
ncbi:nitroreductase [Bacillus spongiae]|uniref:Putative NAD(P)H nitroreductase n=1 Tax=Bacillus spongiae TaxID=2683610 RepID=A0ABU8H9S4_9BACI